MILGCTTITRAIRKIDAYNSILVFYSYVPFCNLSAVTWTRVSDHIWRETIDCSTSIQYDTSLSIQYDTSP